MKLYTKYPRTYHLPTSPGKTSDDKTLPDYSIFESNEVVITEKMDGECFQHYKTYARKEFIQKSLIEPMLVKDL